MSDKQHRLLDALHQLSISIVLMVLLIIAFSIEHKLDLLLKALAQ